MPGRIVVISGPSGVGKTTVCNAILSHPRFTRVVTATSRSPRPGEQDGTDYRFLSEERFLEGIRRGDFLETARVHGNLYGTPRTDVEEGIREGKLVVLNIDVQGARQVREAAAARRLPLTTIFLMPPNLEELRRRLEGRGTEDPETFRRRIETAVQEMEERSLYDHEVVNDGVEGAARRIIAAVEDDEARGMISRGNEETRRAPPGTPEAME
jgi:guanylate kinase